MESAGGAALVAGITGIVGLSLAELMLSAHSQSCPSWQVYGVARRPKPDWFQHHSAAYIQCDLLDRAQTLATLSPLTHITHLFFTTWTNRATEEETVQANASMLRNTLDALLGPHSALKHVCLQTGAKHYLGAFDDITSNKLDSPISIRIFDEDTPRLPGPHFYYAQEDILLEAAASRASMVPALTWSVHRPPAILGVSPASLIQMPFFFATYACICKHDEEGLPFVFTGSPQTWEAPLDAADSHLVAEQQIWAATHSVAHNQAFNVSNGDSMKWRDIWEVTASFFNVQAAPYKGESRSMVQIMQNKAHVWERIVSQYKLKLPTEWEHLMFGWWMMDWALHKIPLYLLSTVKSAKIGFKGSYSDTKASLLANFQTMQTMGLIPHQ